VTIVSTSTLLRFVYCQLSKTFIVRRNIFLLCSVEIEHAPNLTLIAVACGLIGYVMYRNIDIILLALLWPWGQLNL